MTQYVDTLHFFAHYYLDYTTIFQVQKRPFGRPWETLVGNHMLLPNNTFKCKNMHVSLAVSERENCHQIVEVDKKNKNKEFA